MNKIEQINLLIGDRKDLISEFLYQKRSVSSVKEILELPYWEDSKYESLLTSNIWQSNAKEIKAILELPYWNDPKYQPSLTPSIWLRNAQEIQTILELPYWEDPKYQSLLMPAIWNSNAKKIKQILESDILKEEKYAHLLKTSIFSVKLERIQDTIELFKEYNIDSYITIACIRKNTNVLKKLIEYMIANNIDLVIDNKLNPILNASTGTLKNRYNIDIKNLDSKVLKRC